MRGWTLPAICVAFLAYGYYGSELPQDWSIAHAGFDVGEIVNALYMGTSGFFGTPLDVAASYIVLFTIYGAVLNASEIREKFRSLAGLVLTKEGVAAVEDAIDRSEQWTSVDPLTAAVRRHGRA